eukprot:319639_1
MGNDGSHDGEVSSSYSDAETIVNKMGNQYGNYTSTKMIVENNTNREIYISTKKHNNGKWKYVPPETIDSRHFASFLHVKWDGITKGSSGYIQYTVNKSFDIRCYVAWETPYNGTRKCGIYISKGSIVDDAKEELRKNPDWPLDSMSESEAAMKLRHWTTTRHVQRKDNIGYEVEAEIKENKKQVLLYFKISGGSDYLE